MDPVQALTNLAWHADQLAGLTATYTAPATIKCPHLAIWMATVEITGGTDQWWKITARGDLLTAVKGGNLQQELIAPDRFFAPLADLFQSENPDAFHLTRSGLVGHVDFCQLSRIEGNRVIEYPTQTYYGASLFWDIKLRRSAAGDG